MTLDDIIENWQGGPLRLYAKWGPSLLRTDEVREYRPLGNGWAIETELEPMEMLQDLGVELDFDVRDGIVECVGIRSRPDGQPLTPSILRRLASWIKEANLIVWRSNIVRLDVHDGDVIALIPYPDASTPGVVLEADVLSPEVEAEHSRRRRRHLSPELLAEINRLWDEAVEQGKPSAAAYVGAKLGYATGTVRNYRKLARDRAREGGTDGK